MSGNARIGHPAFFLGTVYIRVQPADELQTPSHCANATPIASRAMNGRVPGGDRVAWPCLGQVLRVWERETTTDCGRHAAVRNLDPADISEVRISHFKRQLGWIPGPRSRLVYHLVFFFVGRLSFQCSWYIHTSWIATMQKSQLVVGIDFGTTYARTHHSVSLRSFDSETHVLIHL